MSLKRDPNSVPVIGAVSSADNTTVLPVQIDPTTGRLLVNGIGANTEYTEGDTDTSFTGIIAMAENSDTAKPLQVDASGNLNVNVAAGSASSEQYADATAVDSSYKGNLILGTDGSYYQVISVDSDGNPQVDVLTLPAITIAASQTLDTVNTITNVVHIDDNGGSLTVDGTIDTELKTDDLDTGTGTDTQAIAGIALPAAGGHTLWDGTVVLGAGSNAIGQVDIGDISKGTQTNDVKITLDSEAVILGSPADATYIGDIKFGEALPAGTNNIGDVDVATQPARAATTDSITAKLATDAIQDGLTAVTPKFAIINAASSGDNTVVAAVSGKKLRVLQYTFVCAAATDVTWKSGTGTGAVALSGTMSIAANSGLSTAFSPVGLFETAAGSALNLYLSAANQTSGTLVYLEI